MNREAVERGFLDPRWRSRDAGSHGLSLPCTVHALPEGRLHQVETVNQGETKICFQKHLVGWAVRWRCGNPHVRRDMLEKCAVS